MATQAQYEELKKAYYQGVLTVEYDGKKVTYRSRAEMRMILNEMEEELGLASRTSGRIYHSTSKATDDGCEDE